MQPSDTIRDGLAEIELRKPAKSITEVELEARAHGLSYGKYLAGYRADRELAEMARKREEERRARLKAARRPCADRPAANRKRVVMMDADCKTLRVFESQSDAAKATRFKQGNISAECRRYEAVMQAGGKLRPCHKGVRWRFATEED